MTDMKRPAGDAHPRTGQETPFLRKVSGDDLTTDAQHSTSRGATTTTPKCMPRAYPRISRGTAATSGTVSIA